MKNQLNTDLEAQASRAEKSIEYWDILRILRQKLWDGHGIYSYLHDAYMHYRFIARADRMDQYCMIASVVFFQFDFWVPALITLLNDSNPKHQ